MGTAAHSPARAGGGTPRPAAARARRDLDVSLRDQNLTVARLHAQEPHGAIMSDALEARPRAVVPREAPETSTGPAPAPISRSPSATALDGERLGASRGLERVVAAREPRRQDRGMRAAGSVGGAVGVALARRSRPAASPSKNMSMASLAMPAGDHDDLADRAREVRGRAPRRRRVLRRSPTSARASGSSGSRPSRAAAAARSARPRRGVEQLRPGLGHHHGVEHDRHAARAARRAPRDRRLDRRRVAEHPDLDRVDADVLATARTWATITSGGIRVHGA